MSRFLPVTLLICLPLAGCQKASEKLPPKKPAAQEAASPAPAEAAKPAAEKKAPAEAAPKAPPPAPAQAAGEGAQDPVVKISANPELNNLVLALKDARAGRRVLDELIRRYPEGVSALVRGLRYVEPNIRTQCAQVLVLLHEKKKEKLPKGAVLGLIDLVGKDKNEHVRALGAKALGSSKDERFADVLELALQSDRSGPVRAAAAKSLGELRAKKAIPSLIRALSDRETEVRMYAANSLRKMKAKEAVSQLVQLLGDPNSIVRARAHKALQEITGKNLPAQPEAWRYVMP